MRKSTFGSNSSRFEGDDLHVHALGAPGDLAADAPQADDAERLAGYLGADELVAVPPAGLHDRVGRRNAAGERQHQRDGVFGGRHGVTAGRVHDDDALARRGGHVDVVHADAGSGDRAELARLVEVLGGEFGLRPADDRVGGPECGLEFVALQTGPVIDLDPGGGEQLDPGGFEFVGDQYARHCIFFGKYAEVRTFYSKFAQRP